MRRRQAPPSIPGIESPYLTVREAAAILKVTEKHVYQLVAEGHLHPGRVGRSLRFTREQIHKDVFGRSR